MPGTLFLHQGKWKVSVPTAVGFRHVTLGNVVNFPTRGHAEQRWAELAERGEV